MSQHESRYEGWNETAARAENTVRVFDKQAYQWVEVDIDTFDPTVIRERRTTVRGARNAETQPDQTDPAGLDPADEDAEADARASYFARVHDLREPVGKAVAYLQMGYTASGTAKKLDTTIGTVKSYMDRLEDRFGPTVCHARMPDKRDGRLDAGDPDEYQLPETEASKQAGALADGDDDPREIPEAMLGERRWLCWVEQWDDTREKLTKRPRAPWSAGVQDHTTQGNADATDPANWTTFDEADEWAEMVPGWDVGFAFSPGGPFVGIDLDDCRDAETGTIGPWAREIIERADAFAEVSPSGTGVHIYVRGQLDGSLKNEDEGVELYDRSRFFTVTGRRIGDPQTPLAVPERQDLADDLMETYMSEDAVTGAGPDGARSPGFGSDYDGEYDDSDPFSPFDTLRVTDVYPDLPVGDNIAHPEHDSSTGQNFKIHTGNEGQTAICWKGQHRVGHTEGCGLNAHHLLAMRALDGDDPACDRIRERWATDDELVFRTWLHTVTEEDHIDCDPSPPPWRAMRWIADETGIDGLGDGGNKTRVAIRMICRIIRRHFAVEVDLDTD